MFGRKQAREEDHQGSREAAVSFLERAARPAESLDVSRTVLARAAEARQAKKRSMQAVPA
ncbi:MAG: hypothetical protein ACE14W_03215 [Candidatus Velamenicoccus archaeovorus]